MFFVRTLALILCTTAVCALGAEVPTTPASPFKHPGVLVTQARLDFVKSRIAVGDKLFADALHTAKNSYWASKAYSIRGALAGGLISCGSSSTANNGCKEEQDDYTAAYTHALLWSLTGDEDYAKKSIQIMNHYATRLTGGHGGSNAPLQSAWAGAVWPAAAEIIRHTYSGWSSSEAKAFGEMLKTQFLPHISGTAGDKFNGNWKLSMIDAKIAIAVYNDDRALFNEAVAQWKQWVPAYYYHAGLDGDAPVKFPGSPSTWNGQAVFNATVSGVSQETCRDTQHVGLGMGATFNAAETAYIQGVDLYAVEAKRLIQALEFQSKIIYGTTNTSESHHVPVPADFQGVLCTAVAPPNTHTYVPVLKGTMVRAYNAYAIRKGLALPETLKYIEEYIRPATANIQNDRHSVQWETLTHGASPAVAVE